MNDAPTGERNERVGDGYARRLWLVPAPSDAPEHSLGMDPDVSANALDTDLMRRVRLRDEAAFVDLYDRYAPQVHGIARAILRDEHLAEEATHDLFLGLWQRPEAFDPTRGRFAAWLLRVARNRSIDMLRLRRREQPFIMVPHDEGEPGSGLDSWLVDPAPDPADQAVAHVVGGRVRSALARLMPDQRLLLELAYFKGLTQREIAVQLDRPLGTVKTQIRTAMRRLAELLEEFAPVQSDATGEQPQ